MPFITQGKTNLTYILIVVILAVIVGGGVLAYYYSWIKDLEARMVELEPQLPVVKPSEEVTPEEKPITGLDMNEWISYCENYQYPVYPEEGYGMPSEEERDLCLAYFLSFNKSTDFKILCPKISQPILNEYCLLKEADRKNSDITFHVIIGGGGVWFEVDEIDFGVDGNNFAFVYPLTTITHGFWNFTCDFCEYLFCDVGSSTVPGKPQRAPRSWESQREYLCK